ARELSKGEIAAICRAGAAEVEVFVHGALCMCYSGQCAMSALLGGRSGNRGTCAQPCRLPYAVRPASAAAPRENPSDYPLSLKDSSLAAHLGELAELGVASLKIEGRMKRPEYVAVVTAIYARLLREKRPPTAEEERSL
ncbi:MAG: U32 family peptidase, partial [Ruthenibacterium sp.]